jgi:FtsH-binding integral membrane protein
VSQSPEAGSGKVPVLKRETVMKKVFLILAVAFAFTTGMTAVTVVAHTDQALADCSSGNC